MKRLLSLLLLSACRTVDDDLADLRAERIRLEERLHTLESAPIWVSEGEQAFDRHIRDDDSNIPSFIYDHLFRKLRDRSADSIRAETCEGFDLRRSVASPGEFRGRFWRVTGTITKIWPETIDDPAAPVRRVFAGVIHPGGGSPVYFHLLEKPDILELRSDTVEMDGLFVKVLRFDAPGGRRIEAPFFVAKTLRRML